MSARQASPAARGRHRAAPRRAPLLHRAAAAVAATAVALAAVVVADSASAASHRFVVDSLAASGVDAAKGDGVCATAAGTCTLRAAIEESNALSGPPGSVTITVAPGLSGTITPAMGVSTANWMAVATITTIGDIGAFYEITAPVSIDLDNRVSILPASEPAEVAAIHVNGPDVELRNLTDVFGSGSSIVMGPKAARVTVDGGSSVTRANYFPERFVVYRQGATDVTVRNYHLQGFYDDGATTGLFVFNATNTTAMRNITIDGVDVTHPSSGACTPTDGSGCSTNLTRFYPRTTSVVLDGFSFTGSTVQDLPRKFGFKFADDGAAGVQVSNLTISGNRFLNVQGYGTGNEYAFITLPHRWLAGTNTIAGNQFVRASTGNSVAIFWDGASGSGSTASNLTITDNYFDGYTDASVRLTRSGLVSVEKNRFGPRTASQARPATSEETAHTSVMLDNAAATANRQVATWYPSTAATVLSGPVPAEALRTQVPAGTTAPLCTAAMDVTKPTSGTAPWSPTSTLDVYWTAGDDAEIYLGRVTGVVGSPQRVHVDLPVGALPLPGADPAQIVDPATGAVDGFVRVQTLVPESGATASSQYSRTVALTGTCAPTLTLDQGPGQADPAMGRDLHYQLTSSVPLDPASITASDFTLAATATSETIDAARINPRIESITAAPGSGDTTYDIVVRVDDSATTSLSLDAGKVTAVSGVASTGPASSTDGQITFVNPVTVSPSTFSLVTGDTDGKSYTLAVRPGAPAPSAPLDFAVTLDQVGTDHGLTVSTTTPTIAAGATTSAPVTVTAPAAQVPSGTLTTIAHTLTSADTGYDGLVVEPVHPYLFTTDPTIHIDKQAFVDVADTTSAATIAATGTRAPTGARLNDGQAVCFVYTVTNTSAGAWATRLTDVRVTDSDRRLGSAGLIGTVAGLGVGQSTQVFACTSLIDTTAS